MYIMGDFNWRQSPKLSCNGQQVQSPFNIGIVLTRLRGDKFFCVDICNQEQICDFFLEVSVMF